MAAFSRLIRLKTLSLFWCEGLTGTFSNGSLDHELTDAWWSVAGDVTAFSCLFNIVTLNLQGCTGVIGYEDWASGH